MAISSAAPVAGVIVAAGSGIRLGGHIPKALREVRGRSLVARSADALVSGGCTHLVVVVADGLQEHFRVALRDVEVPVSYAIGGLRRQDSVVEGLRVVRTVPGLEDCRVVLVHDAARALVPPAVVRTVIDTVRAGAAAVIPVTPMIDSVRREQEHGSAVVDRHDLRLVQTPQGFDLDVLTRSHAEAMERGLEVTDDAAVCEATGHAVELVAGSRDSIKITEPFDLLVADAICAAREEVADAEEVAG